MPAGVFMSGTGCKRAAGTCESVIDSVHMSQRRVDMDGCVDMVNQAVCRTEGRREGGASTGTQPGGILSVSAPNVFVLFFPTKKMAVEFYFREETKMYPTCQRTLPLPQGC